MYGRCTRSVAGSSSLLATVSENSMRISSTNCFLEQQTLSLSFYHLCIAMTLLLLPQAFWTVSQAVLVLPNNGFYSQLRSTVLEELHFQLSNQTQSSPCPKPFSKLLLIQSTGQLYQNFILCLECLSDFVHRKYQIICCKICDWWHVKVFGSHDDFFASSYLTFTVTSKKY